MFHKFKEGDLVYNLNSDNSIHKVHFSTSKSTNNPLLVTNPDGITDAYTKDGRLSYESPLPSLILATEKNRKALVTIFGDVFQTVEEYESMTNPFNTINSLIEEQGFAWCGVSLTSLEDARRSAENNLFKITDAVNESGINEFYDTKDRVYTYAVPIDPNTGEEITSC